MPRRYGVSFIICVCLLAAAGCSGADNQIAPTNAILQPSATVLYEISTSTQAAVIPSQVIIKGGTDAGWIISDEAGAYLGEVMTVRVELSQCSFKPNINGSPTFCNDQPYPDHAFTYLIWGKDLRHFDQLCVLVTGEIMEYDGKPQIVVDSEEQILPCDG